MPSCAPAAAQQPRPAASVTRRLPMQGMYPYLYFGVCDGSHDVLGGWRATSDLGACLYSAFDGKKVVDGAFADFGAATPRQGDRVGVLVDTDKGEATVFVNDVPQARPAAHARPPRVHGRAPLPAARCRGRRGRWAQRGAAAQLSNHLSDANFRVCSRTRSQSRCISASTSAGPGRAWRPCGVPTGKCSHTTCSPSSTASRRSSRPCPGTLTGRHCSLIRVDGPPLFAHSRGGRGAGGAAAGALSRVRRGRRGDNRCRRVPRGTRVAPRAPLLARAGRSARQSVLAAPGARARAAVRWSFYRLSR
jgi:hypothetical protein